MRTKHELEEDHPFTGRTEFHKPTRSFSDKRGRKDKDWKDELDEIYYSDDCFQE